MNALLHVGALVLGIAIISLALGSAIRVVILPRQASYWIGQVVFRTNYRLFRSIASRRTTFDGRDRIMAPWSSDRSLKEWRRSPRVVRWGRRLRAGAGSS